MARTEISQQRRARLVESAARLVHQRGVSHSTVADIAEDAEVPPGSVYYFFKTKEDIIEAIVEKRLQDLERSLGKASNARTPHRRLERLLQMWVDDREIDTMYGCPLGSLCYEIAKGHNPMSVVVLKPLQLLLQWAEKQFRELGLSSRESAGHALHLIAALQGISLIANAFGEVDMIVRETRRLKSWIKQVASSRTTP